MQTRGRGKAVPFVLYTETRGSGYALFARNGFVYPRRAVMVTTESGGISVRTADPLALAAWFLGITSLGRSKVLQPFRSASYNARAVAVVTKALPAIEQFTFIVVSGCELTRVNTRSFSCREADTESFRADLSSFSTFTEVFPR